MIGEMQKVIDLRKRGRHGKEIWSSRREQVTRDGDMVKEMAAGYRRDG